MTPEALCMGCMGDKGADLHCPVCGWQEGSPAESLLQLPPRTVLDGRYLIGKALGQGGFGITYLAWDLNLECKLAVKEYFPRDICTRARDECTVQPVTQEDRKTFQGALKSFEEEGRALARFRNHPGVVSVLGFFQENGTAYIVMAYAEGMTLKEHLNRQGGSLLFDEALRLLVPVMDTLREVHSVGMLHRDISPDNIYLTLDSQVKLLDFGNARYVLGERSRSLSAVLKPGYAPEEQFRRQGHQGPWTDVYALAATFYRVLTGRIPPDAHDRLAHDDLIPPSQLGIEIPRRAEEALLKALAVRQEGRFQSVADFQDALTRMRPPVPPPWWHAVLEYIRPRAKAAILVMALVGILAVVLWGILRPRVGRLTVSANVGGAEISIDGRTQPGWLTPHTFPKLRAGPHDVSAVKDGYQAAGQRVNVRAGADDSLQLNLAPTPQVGGLDVRTNPAGATILLDGHTEPGWVTPHTFSGLPARTYAITVSKEGYQSISRDAAVGLGSIVPEDFDLIPNSIAPLSAQLTVTANVEGAKILIDGQSQPGWLTPHTFPSLRAGSYRVTVVKDGYQSANQTVTIAGGVNSSAKFTLQPPSKSPGTGELIVTSNPPGARIVIDGADTGFSTPYTFPALPARPHAVSLLKDDYDPAGGSYIVEAGRSVTANLTLSKPTPRFKLEVLEISQSNPLGVPIVADVSIDGKSYGHSPVNTDLPPGPHHYRVIAGSRSEEGSFEIHSGAVGTSEVVVKIPKS